MDIKNISAREILNSGATTSLEVKVELKDGSNATASVPFGASAGSHEAFVLFDNDTRYAGRGMLKAVKNINTEIKNALIGQDALDQEAIDQKMIDLDGTENKKRLGGNAILGVSLAVAKAAAKSQNQELYQYINQNILKNNYQILEKDLPRPMVVVIEGGKHAANSTDFQEYLLVSQIKNQKGKISIRESVRAAAESYLSLKKILKDKGYNTNVGNEGAYAPAGIKTNTEPWDLILQTVKQAGYQVGQDIMLAADPACSEVFGKDGKYHLKTEDKILTSQELIDYFAAWLDKYPFFSLEDVLDEDDWENWRLAQEKLGSKTRLIGDDLLVTNPKRLKRAIEEKSCSAILIKLNQIGSLSETVKTIEMAHKFGFWTIVSHRGGGETNDTSMIDLAVACGSKAVKVGISRGERVCKYNRLMEIENKLLIPND